MTPADRAARVVDGWRQLGWNPQPVHAYPVVEFRRSESTWRRYHDADDGNFSVFATGPDDDSPNHSVGRGYDPRCSCCWLNFGHTADYHAVSVAESVR